MTRPGPAALLDGLALAAAASGVALVLQALLEPPGHDALAWFLCLSRELALALALWATGVALLRRQDGSWRPLARSLTALVFGASSVLGLMAQNFFLHTGTAVELSVLTHAYRRLGELGGALSTGVTPAFLLRVALVGLVFGAGYWNAMRRATARADQAPRQTALLVALLSWLVAAALPNFGTRVPFSRAMWLNAFAPASAVEYAGPSVALAYEQPRVSRPPTPARQPDIILLIIESGRADILDDPKRAPNLHALAAESLRPQRTYATTSHTTKALVGIMCGIPPAPEMELTESFPGGIPTDCLPRLLSGLGYHTAFFQSADGAFEDRFRLVENFGFAAFTAQAELLAASPELEPWGYLAMDDRAMAAPILAALEAEEGPHFIAALTSTMHHPYEAVGLDGKGSGRPPRELYGEAVGMTDELVGKLLAGLRDAGRLENTVLVVVGDHGEAFGEHGRGQHDAVPYEEGVRTPLLVRLPSAEGSELPGNWQHLDILPTVVELAGGQIAGALPGRSLLGPPDATRSITTNCWYQGWCTTLVEGKHKAIYHYDRQPLELFDLDSDPDESINLASELGEQERRLLETRVLAHRAGIEELWSRLRKGEVPRAPESKTAKAGQRRAQCYDQCVADSDPEREGLQPSCTIVENHPSGPSMPIPACTEQGLPEGASACWQYRADTRLHPDCRAAGLNLELGVQRTERIRPGAMLDIRCRLSEDPARDCPRPGG